MFSFWDILNVLIIIEGILAFILFLYVVKLARKPIGFRLVLLSVIFIIQSILSIAVYNYWRSLGYGVEIALPLIILQSTILAGLIVLIDIVKY